MCSALFSMYFSPFVSLPYHSLQELATTGVANENSQSI